MFRFMLFSLISFYKFIWFYFHALKFSGICNQPPQTGPCRNYQPGYYFDPKSESCQQFIYGGCRGNDNRFNSLEECERRCGESVVQSMSSFLVLFFLGFLVHQWTRLLWVHWPCAVGGNVREDEKAGERTGHLPSCAEVAKTCEVATTSHPWLSLWLTQCTAEASIWFDNWGCLGPWFENCGCRGS